MSATARKFSAFLRTHRLNQQYGYRHSMSRVAEMTWLAGLLIQGGYSSEFDDLWT